jgi:AcrR family transcriptional regulator
MEPADTESRLRDVALDLFGRHGVQGTSTRDILKAAGLRNPSAISYHFGSKAGLVEDLVWEIRSRAWPVVELQVDLVKQGKPSLEEWVGVAADSAAELVSTERGSLLARILWEYDCVLAPDAFEEFLGSGDPLARAWQDAIAQTFPHLPRFVAVSRNFLTVHTIEWLLNRTAGRNLNGQRAPALKVKHPEDLRDVLFEISMALLSAPSRFNEDEVVFED